MNKFYFLAIAAIAVNFLCVTNSVAQSYDVLNLNGKLAEPETYWEGDQSGPSSPGQYGGTTYSNTFSDGVFAFSNAYTVSDWGSSWSGFAYTNTTDVTTAGYTNMSAITGGGYNDGLDDTYVIASLGGDTKITFADRAAYKDVSMYITNASYAYLSMQTGDDYAKKFGGDDGTDLDSLMLIATVYGADKQIVGEKRLALADFRFENSDDDYIVNEWTAFDLSSFGRISAISFSMESSDNGMFGMNTPAYFCLDGLRGTKDGLIANEEVPTDTNAGDIYYANGTFYINDFSGARIQVVSMTGATVASFVVSSDGEAVPFVLTKGVYVVQAIKDGKAYTCKISAQ